MVEVFIQEIENRSILHLTQNMSLLEIKECDFVSRRLLIVDNMSNNLFPQKFRPMVQVP